MEIEQIGEVKLFRCRWRSDTVFCFRTNPRHASRAKCQFCDEHFRAKVFGLLHLDRSQSDGISNGVMRYVHFPKSAHKSRRMPGCFEFKAVRRFPGKVHFT